MEKYGVDNYSKTNDFKININIHNKEKHGVEWYQQSDEFKLKSKQTCMEKYGVEYSMQSNIIKNKVKSTNINKYGVDHYSKTDEFKEKFKLTSIKNYGVEHPMLSTSHKNKISKSILDKYGFPWFVMSNEFKEHMKVINVERYKKYLSTMEKRYNSISSNRFLLKEYKLPSHKIINVQGYENFALDLIFRHYTEDDIFIKYSDIINHTGIILYLQYNFIHMYIPDIYIKSENKIIEVKSIYTYEKDIEKIY